MKKISSKIDQCLHVFETESNNRIDNSKEKLLDFKERAKNSRLQVGIIGEFKAGKSTLVNALLGRKALPVGVKETTSKPVRISWGEQEKFISVSVNGKEKEHPHAEWLKLGELGESINIDKSKDILELKYVAPIPLLQKKVDFSDCPGLGSSTHEMQLVTRNFIQGMDAVLYVVRISNNPFNKKEAELIHEFLGKDEFAKMIFVVNGIDELQNNQDANEEESIAEIRKNIADITGLDNPRIAFVSSANALFDAEKGIPYADDTGFPDFLEMLNELLFGQAMSLLKRSLDGKVNREIKGLIDDMSVQLDYSLNQNKNTEMKISQLQRKMTSRKDFVSELISELKNYYENWSSAVPSKIDTHCINSIRSCEIRLKESDQVHLKESDIEQWVQQELRGWLTDLEKNWLEVEQYMKSMVTQRLSVLNEEYNNVLVCIKNDKASTGAISLAVNPRLDIQVEKNTWEEMEDIYTRKKQNVNSRTIAGGLLGGFLGALAVAIFPPLGILGVIACAGGGAFLGNNEECWDKVKTGVRKVLKARIDVSFDSIFKGQSGNLLIQVRRVGKQKQEELLRVTEIGVNEKMQELEDRILFLKNDVVDVAKSEEMIRKLTLLLKEV